MPLALNKRLLSAMMLGLVFLSALAPALPIDSLLNARGHPPFSPKPDLKATVYFPSFPSVTKDKLPDAEATYLLSAVERMLHQAIFEDGQFLGDRVRDDYNAHHPNQKKKDLACLVPTEIAKSQIVYGAPSAHPQSESDYEFSVVVSGIFPMIRVSSLPSLGWNPMEPRELYEWKMSFKGSLEKGTHQDHNLERACGSLVEMGATRGKTVQVEMVNGENHEISPLPEDVKFPGISSKNSASTHLTHNMYGLRTDQGNTS
ncbi:hypothetical protein EV360DRAFT_68899 [Lentinula raphanica]|nr:hypothetical protein EV360DRAFT_68899 [Lentinula raphanica]